MATNPVDDRLEAPGDRLLPVNGLINKLQSILPDSEKDRSALFRLENNRREYIAAHALCRRMLSEFSDTQPASWRFETGPHGKPEIIAGGDLRFNISHTKGLVCSAVTVKSDIGVDIERMGRGNDLERVAEGKFSGPERGLLRRMTAAEKTSGFFSFWTLKEAYIKATGMGLAEPLDGFAFTLEPLAVQFLNGQDDRRAWRFDLFEPAAGYLGAVAVRCGRGGSLKVIRRTLDMAQLAAMI